MPQIHRTRALVLPLVMHAVLLSPAALAAPGPQLDVTSPTRAAADRALAMAALDGKLSKRTRAQLDRPEIAALPVGHVVVYPQRIRGVPVVGGRVIVRLDGDDAVRYTRSSTADVPSDFSTTPLVDADTALSVAAEAVAATVPPRLAPELVIRAWSPRHPRLAWRVVFPYHEGHVWQLYVDAADGTVLAREDLVSHATSGAPLGRAYIPSPALSQVQDVELAHLSPGVETLADDVFEVLTCVDPGRCTARPDGAGGETFVHTCELVPLALADSRGDFLYAPPSDPLDRGDAFAEVQSYYHLRKAYAWLEGLGFTGFATVPMEVHTNVQTGVACEGEAPSGPMAFYDNAHYAHDSASGGIDHIAVGQGSSFDFALDGDVLYHELGHAVMARSQISASIIYNPHGADLSGPAVNEAFADYFTAALTDDPAIAEYVGSVSGQPWLRHLETPKTCPSSLSGEQHNDGEFFAAAMWAARQEVQDVAAFDRGIVHASGLIGPNDNYAAVASLLVAEVELSAGAEAAATLRRHFQDRGMSTCDARIVDLELGKEVEVLYFFGAPEVPLPGPVQFRLTLDRELPAGLSVSLLAAPHPPVPGAPPISLQLRMKQDAPVVMDEAAAARAELEYDAPVAATFAARPGEENHYDATIPGPIPAGTHYIMLNNLTGISIATAQVVFEDPSKADTVSENEAEDGAASELMTGCAVAGHGHGWLGVLLLGLGVSVGRGPRDAERAATKTP